MTCGLNTSILSNTRPVTSLPKIEDNTKIHAAGFINSQNIFLSMYLPQNMLMRLTEGKNKMLLERFKPATSTRGIIITGTLTHTQNHYTISTCLQMVNKVIYILQDACDWQGWGRAGPASHESC